jgi:acetylornithine deacetylase/succinyl-diaminopimelate desuccinylase-like protein
MRIVPGADAERELELLVAHLRSVAPWHVDVQVTPLKAGWPFAVDMNGPTVQAAEASLTEAFGVPVEAIGSGGSIPLINSLKNACPRADVILWGAEDTKLSRIHASNESVDPAEIERMVLAQVLTLQKLASP